MKQSWVIAVVTLYVVFHLLGSVAEGSLSITSSQVSQAQGLMQPIMTDVSPLNSIPVIGLAVSLITNIGSYFISFMMMVFLWYPTLWSGTWMWFYWLFVMPVSIGMIMAIVTMLRGSQSG